MLDGVLLLWFVLTGLSLAFVLWDSLTNTPVSWVSGPGSGSGAGFQFRGAMETLKVLPW